MWRRRSDLLVPPPYNTSLSSHIGTSLSPSASVSDRSVVKSSAPEKMFVTAPSASRGSRYWWTRTTWSEIFRSLSSSTESKRMKSKSKRERRESWQNKSPVLLTTATKLSFISPHQIHSFYQHHPYLQHFRKIRHTWSPIFSMGDLYGSYLP